MEEDSCNDECAPPDLIDADTTQVVSLKVLSEKSRKRYEFIYEQFMHWRKKKHIKTSFSENVLLTYIHEMSKKVKPSTLWTQYSMLRSTLIINHNVDISKYFKLRGLLKRLSTGYKPQKSKCLTAEEVNEFIVRAPDEKFLFAKVALIVGISGACGTQELAQLSVDDIEDLNSAAIIKIQTTANKASRRFTITGIYYDIYKKYASSRPEPIMSTDKRFFLKYQNGKCTRQVVGVNKMGAVAKTVASFLKLDNPELYTGHSFRRLSAATPTEGGRDMTTLKSQEALKFEPVEEIFLNECCEDIKCE